MDLQHLIQMGFSTRSLCGGGSEEHQCPRWLASKNQQFLLNKLRGLYVDVTGVDADESLSDVGRAKKKTELAARIMADLEAESAKLRALIESKGDAARNRLAQASRPVGETDIDRVARLLETQNLQRFLLDLDAQNLLGELARAVRDGDGRTYEAVTSLPSFILRQKSITQEMIDASRREWSRRVDPVAAGDVESAEVMARLVTEDLATATRAVREFTNLPEERMVRSL